MSTPVYVTTACSRRSRSGVSAESPVSHQHTPEGWPPISGRPVEYGWLVNNASKYGLKSGVSQGEPWHVGMGDIGDDADTLTSELRASGRLPTPSVVLQTSSATRTGLRGSSMLSPPSSRCSEVLRRKFKVRAFTRQISQQDWCYSLISSPVDG